MRKKGGRGDFFVVDGRCWHNVCGISLNAAVTYLVMARGSARDHATTRWSVNAIEKYTGVSRPLAKKAIRELVDGELIEIVKGGIKPHYRLRTWVEVEIWTEQDFGCLTEPSSIHWIWLPNTLIDGVPGNAAAPVELVRQTQQIEAMRLFIDLYKVHDLCAFGGLHWRLLSEKFSRELVGHSKENTIWAFKRLEKREVFPNNEFFSPFMNGRKYEEGVETIWRALNLLESLGLFEFIPHLIEADNDGAAMIQPFGWREGEPSERRLAVATHKLGRVMINIVQPKGSMLVPAKRHLT